MPWPTTVGTAVWRPSSGLAGDQLDIRRMPWQMHVFTPVHGIPGVSGPGTVAVLQVAHAFADGARGSAMAAWLFGREVPVPAVRPPAGFLPWRAVGRHPRPPQVGPRHTRGAAGAGAGNAAAAGNQRPTRRRAHDPHAGAATLAIAGSHRDRRGVGRDIDGTCRICSATVPLRWAAEVPMAKPGAPHAYNHFGNVVVGLYPQLGHEDRLQRIADRSGQWSPPLRASGHARGRPGFRRGARCAVALGHMAIRCRASGRRRCPATPWCPASTAERPT